MDWPLQEVCNAGILFLKCGISRPTLRKWLRRYEQQGVEVLKGHSRRPKNSPARKVTAEHERIILSLRRDWKLGHRRICMELQRLHVISPPIATIYKIIQRYGVAQLNHKRDYRKGKKRYNRPIPGEPLIILPHPFSKKICRHCQKQNGQDFRILVFGRLLPKGRIYASDDWVQTIYLETVHDREHFHLYELSILVYRY